MTKRIVYVLVFLHGLVLACSPSPRQEEKKTLTVQQVNEYPDLVLTFENGETLSTRKLQGNNLFVLFQPDCDHCQEEAIHIEQRLGDFKDYKLYFISSSPMDHIMGFAKNFNLAGKESVQFVWTAPQGVLDHYGPIQTPSIYIYSNGKLKGSFHGPTGIDSILEAL